MESLNMSRLQLTSVTVSTAKENEAKSEDIEKPESNTLTDTKDDFQCMYKEDIWKHLLAQEAEKQPIHLQSPQLQFRGTLVRQLRGVAKQLGLSMATLHSAAALLDLFMDAHRLRADRLTHIALACLSLAAKNEEKFNVAPSLKVLSSASGVHLCGKIFRQLEWMVGQHARWRLLAPTPVTFAALLAQYVVADSDLTSHHPKFVRRFRKDGARLLEAYLDLTLSDVRLKVVESVDVGCACVACARADLGLAAWPAWLVTIAGRKPTTVAPIARLLQRMMQMLKSRNNVESDQGYGSALTSPNLTPCTSPKFQTCPKLSTCSTSAFGNLNVEGSYREHAATERIDTRGGTAHSTTNRRASHPATERGGATFSRGAVNDGTEYSVLDLDDSNPPPTHNVEGYYALPTAVDVACHRVNHPADYRYCVSSRLLETSLDATVQPSTSVAVKRGLDANSGTDIKQYRLAHVSQIVL